MITITSAGERNRAVVLRAVWRGCPRPRRSHAIVLGCEELLDEQFARGLSAWTYVLPAPRARGRGRPHHIPLLELPAGGLAWKSFSHRPKRLAAEPQTQVPSSRRMSSFTDDMSQLYLPECFARCLKSFRSSGRKVHTIISPSAAQDAVAERPLLDWHCLWLFDVVSSFLGPHHSRNPQRP